MDQDLSHIKDAYILAVDDFGVVRRILLNLLRAKGAFVDEAHNGMVALDKLRMACENDVPYDLIILDVEMPVLGGIEFLSHLRADPKAADTPVVVISAHSERQDIKQCANLGTVDYVIKPLTKDRLYAAVSKALLKRRRKVPDQNAENLISKVVFRKLESLESLPTLPGVLEAIRKLSDDPNAGSGQFARIVQDDSAIMANIFKIANSVAYGAREHIDSLEMAITRLGLQVVYNIAATVGVLNIFRDAENTVFDNREFCRHSISVGITMQVLYDVWRQNFDVAFPKGFLHLVGLLHDIGKIVVVCLFKKEYCRTLEFARQRSLPLFDAELKTLGTQHAEVGAWLSRKWNLAPNLSAAIQFHHTPLMADDQVQAMVMLCHAANYICNVERIGDGGDTITPMLDQRSFQRIGITMSDIPTIVHKVQQTSAHSEVLMSILK